MICGCLLLAFSWSCRPPGPLVLRVLVCAFLALCLFLVFFLVPLLLSPLCVFLFVFLPAILRLSSPWPLCAAFGVAGFPCLLFLVRCGVAPLPRWLLSPFPPSVVPLRRPGPVTVPLQDSLGRP